MRRMLTQIPDAAPAPLTGVSSADGAYEAPVSPAHHRRLGMGGGPGFAMADSISPGTGHSAGDLGSGAAAAAHGGAPDRRTAEARAGPRCGVSAVAEPDRMLAFYRVRAGLEPKAGPYGGWDGDGRNLTGHIAGHYLSAVSLMWAATGDARFKQRADYIVDELKIVQDKHGDGFAGALLNGGEAFAEVSQRQHPRPPAST